MTMTIYYIHTRHRPDQVNQAVQACQHSHRSVVADQPRRRPGIASFLILYFFFKSYVGTHHTFLYRTTTFTKVVSKRNSQRTLFWETMVRYIYKILRFPLKTKNKNLVTIAIGIHLCNFRAIILILIFFSKPVLDFVKRIVQHAPTTDEHLFTKRIPASNI